MRLGFRILGFGVWVLSKYLFQRLISIITPIRDPTYTSTCETKSMVNFWPFRKGA